MKVLYVVTYAISEFSVKSGVLGIFTSLYAANKYKNNAEIALKNSGLAGTLNVEANVIGDSKDPDTFFQEF
jgi:hypothetical protein